MAIVTIPALGQQAQNCYFLPLPQSLLPGISHRMCFCGHQPVSFTPCCLPRRPMRGRHLFPHPQILRAKTYAPYGTIELIHSPRHVNLLQRDPYFSSTNTFSAPQLESGDSTSMAVVVQGLGHCGAWRLPLDMLPLSAVSFGGASTRDVFGELWLVWMRHLKLHSHHPLGNTVFPIRFWCCGLFPKNNATGIVENESPPVFSERVISNLMPRS